MMEYGLRISFSKPELRHENINQMGSEFNDYQRKKVRKDRRQTATKKLYKKSAVGFNNMNMGYCFFWKRLNIITVLKCFHYLMCT